MSKDLNQFVPHETVSRKLSPLEFKQLVKNLNNYATSIPMLVQNLLTNYGSVGIKIPKIQMLNPLENESKENWPSDMRLYY